MSRNIQEHEDLNLHISKKIGYVLLIAIFFVLANISWLSSIPEANTHYIIATSIGFAAIWIVAFLLYPFNSSKSN
jgi:uncharacterized Tic20 family protein